MELADVRDRTVVLAGTLTRIGAADAREALVALGARVADHVTPGIDLVFAGEDGGADAERALALAIPVHGEADLLALLAAAGAANLAQIAFEKVLERVHGADAVAPATASPPSSGQRARLPSVAELDALHEIRWGMPLARLLLTYLRVLARRPDVHVLVDAPGAPASMPALQRLDGKAPPALVALAADVASLDFEWGSTPTGPRMGS